MTAPTTGRTKRGAAGLAHPGALIATLRSAHTARVGKRFTDALVRGSWLVIVGTWLMVVALILAVVAGVVIFVVTASLQAAFITVLAFIVLIVIGFIILQAGQQARNRALRELGQRMVKLDPGINVDKALAYIRQPATLDRWSAVHPGLLPLTE
jgi:small-conductance mechanosensitive channel